jgi:hypothetical protein
MKKKDLYNNYLSKLEEALQNNNYEGIDYILEFMYTAGIDEDTIEEIDELLQEATLYSELKKDDYKERSLELISLYK